MVIFIACVSVSDQAIYGQAIDRHLLGLKLQGIEDLTSMPEIFMDTSYAVAQHFNLLTSQVDLYIQNRYKPGGEKSIVYYKRRK